VAQAKLPGVILFDDYVRHYPLKFVGAGVVGFTTNDGTGLEGIEKYADLNLRGAERRREIARDGLGRTLSASGAGAQTAAPSQSVVLTLDAYIQAVAEEELARGVAQFAARDGCAVVLDAVNGDVLALAGFPAYDLNHARETAPEYRLLSAIASTFEPGSIFKPVVIAAALEQQVVTPTTDFFCENGAWTMPGTKRVLHDSHPYGNLTTTGIFVKSSNIGVAKIAARLGMEKLHRAITAFGFGKPSGLPLGGELGGKVFPLEKWTSFSRGSVPMGQEITTTPVQMALAYCVFAADGTLPAPRLIRELVDAQGQPLATIPVQKRRRVLSPATAKIVREMLAATVRDGTGKHAKSELYDLGGKTGTAQLAVNAAERARGLKGYSPERYVGSFVALAPIAQPKIVTLVSIREPNKTQGYYGGTVAAPAAKAIVERTLQYLQVPTKAECR
jgi:cell division protein FtsI/penicillin-binding protein 2